MSDAVLKIDFRETYGGKDILEKAQKRDYNTACVIGGSVKNNLTLT